MRRLLLSITAAGLGWWLTSAAAYAQQELPREPVPAVVDVRVEVEPLTRGPIHEAFAHTTTMSTGEPLTIGREPPPMIDEIPPAQRPTGEDVAWIPGYWGWDDERKDFIWISGIWRAIPPNREWVPGYWARVTDGYQWISGYWRDIRIEEVEYLPPPPETVDAGPTTDPPTGDEIWIPGCWIWQQNSYAWRPGYWAHGNPRWVWTNSHYVYTTRGYIFVNGFWDFLVPQRGVLFAPVYFNGQVPRTYVYSPRLVVNTYALLDHLFLRPNYRHYYFGDYYGANYRTRGILPYFVFNNSRFGFDSLYSFHRWQHRHDRDWHRHLESRYETLREHEDRRPPRDYASWQAWAKRHDHDHDHIPFFAGSLQDFSRFKGNTWKFRDLDDDARRTAGSLWRDLDRYRQNRIRVESERTARTGDNDRASDRVRYLKPPITSDIGRTGDRDRDDRVGRDGDRTGRDADRPGFDRGDLPGARPGRDDDRPGVRPGREADTTPRLDRDPPAVPRVGDTPSDRPGRLDTTPGLDRPGARPDLDRPNTKRVLPDGPTGGRASDGTIPKREAPRNPRDLPGPLNDIRDIPKDAPKGATNRDRDNDGRPGVTSPRTLPGSDNELPNRPQPRTTAPGLDRGDTPKTSPAPRATPKASPRNPLDTPKATPAPRPTPKAAPAPRANPMPTPRANPAPTPRANPQAAPRNDRPGNSGDRPGNAGGNRPGGGERPGNAGGGRSGGDRPGNSGGDRGKGGGKRD